MAVMNAMSEAMGPSSPLTSKRDAVLHCHR
jgi:hypothetical protein